MVKKRYYRNESLGLAWDRAEVYKMNLFTNTMNSNFTSQFGYCPLASMNRSRTLNNCINGLHKQAFSLVYNDLSSGFSELSEKDKSLTIHHRNL